MDVTRFLGVLQSFGISVSASAFVEFLKRYLASRRTEAVGEFTEQLDSFLRIHGANVQASTIINAFAAQGLLSIQQSSLYAPQQVTMGADRGATFVFGNNSRSRTDKTAIHAQGSAQIVGSNAAIVQNPDGSISFHVGSDRKK